ncbi:hypothetical protein [Stutzerimonas stutzeri]|uniref:hypothetical protein n=1 Tax=Stutzerimonas stutzeri TaxID=316 RepID=UPI001BCD8127|nr:hypothetical protein [Stutzerimonas stutzeri]
MNTIGKIFAGIVTGYILAIIIGTVLLQGKLFLDGMELLGISKFGLIYFLGGILASLGLLIVSPAARSWKRLLVLYPIAMIMVGAVAGGHEIEAAVGAPRGALANPNQMLSDMVHLVANGAFWLVPAIVVIAYSVMIFEKRTVAAT